MAMETYRQIDNELHPVASARELVARIACIPMLAFVLALMVIRPESFQPDE